ncbi:MAG: hypothetical protein CR968_04420 [Flavobacteriia bacterium]|nr:MAG: hypothetical protein CR968_04420 [Flavobacteriia bacterium]
MTFAYRFLVFFKDIKESITDIKGKNDIQNNILLPIKRSIFQLKGASESISKPHSIDIISINTAKTFKILSFFIGLFFYLEL